ncbi:Hint domain-containing protein [Nioella ostreopsis]|uniref:Hint domain-containing protein n=1 Tax=Nioella ostreopsis TaxID=2448479 RepID=UPI000FDC9604|nr:Hint domain-containing protein [Nioella ostreopsis]
MPAYVATHSTIYGDTGGRTDNWLPGTVTDNNGDVWVLSEAMDDGGTGNGSTVIIGSGTFAGTVTVNGKEFPVLLTGSNDYTVLYDNATDHAQGLLDFATHASIASALDTSDFTACFAEGTGIATSTGDVAVETLSIGDTVLNADGAEVAVKWIGRQTVKTMFKPAERVAPVRFAAGSLGEGLPVTDLTVTADHGMLVSGIICHAGALVNGTTITRVPMKELGESYTVYHVEAENHEIILANGAPAETFIDNVSRRVFDNFAEFEALYGDVPEMEELPYPRAMSARQVPQKVRGTLDSRCVA